MSAPHLNRRLVLEAPDRVSDGAGGFTETWVELGSMWADVRARTGRERSVAGAAVSSMAYRIIVRAAEVGSGRRPGPEQRFRDGVQVFVIQAVAEHDPAGRFLTCFATQEVAV